LFTKLASIEHPFDDADAPHVSSAWIRYGRQPNDHIHLKTKSGTFEMHILVLDCHGPSHWLLIAIL